ncbi:MAG: RsmD family RNA methyltransferase, partial [Pelagibacteraceae bacterium]|nr:RsmD family RNA methyltransferase [Pelagibacteraceae bacterium]
PKNLKTRPLKDSVKENIFNILNHSNNINIEIKNSNVIDLYAGTGSFGLECLSRGTSRVFFVENDLYALKNLKKNIEDLNITHKATIYSQDVFKFLDI